MSNIDDSNWAGSYSYGKDGNIRTLTINGQNTSFQYDTNSTNGSVYDSDIMTKWGGTNLSWDENGRMVAGVLNLSLEYNWDGKLRHAHRGAWLDLKYDPMGNRICHKYTTTQTTTDRRYIVDVSGGLPVILCEIDPADANNVPVNSYVYINGQVMKQYQHTGGNNIPYFYIHDRLGSVRLVVDEDAAMKNTYTYDPYGGNFATDCNETGTYNPFKFAGQWFDPSVYLYDMRARIYDPFIKRFTSRDPIFGKFEEPLTLHKYLYCGNDSINKVDLDGKWAVVVTGGFDGTIASDILGSIAESGVASLARGGLGYHALMRQALIGLMAMDVDAGLGGNAGAGMAFGKGEKGYFFGSIYFGAGGGSVSNGSGFGVTTNFGYSPNAETLQSLAGKYTEYGGSATFKAPPVSLFFGFTLGGSLSVGDNGVQLWNITAGGGTWSSGVAWEGHVYQGKAFVAEW